jgi:putative flavoprotein involved in K+ transport
LLAEVGDEPPARTVDALIVGAGHAGLAVSRCLSDLSINHVVLERGEIANSWRRERWESLTLLTPNWQSRLPGFSYSGSDPDGYMTMPEVIEFIDQYAKKSGAPVLTQTPVVSVRQDGELFKITTNSGVWRSRCVVVASGACNHPSVPKVANSTPEGIASVTTHDYRNPAQLADGGVLVVGASATGLQLAEEIHRSGRSVTLAVGEHVRLPRVYRGRDIQWWMDAAGVLDETIGEMDDIVRARNIPSPQLVGSRDKPILDLNSMSAIGVKLVGRLMGINAGTAQFSGSLRNVCSLADLKMNRLLNLLDEWADANNESLDVGPVERFERTQVDTSPCLNLDLTSGEIRTIVWATGYRPDYSWLELPVLDRKGKIRHEEGVVSTPGLYVIGLPFMRRRKSSFIHGTEDDARFITGQLDAYLRSIRQQTLSS